MGYEENFELRTGSDDHGHRNSECVGADSQGERRNAAHGDDIIGNVHRRDEFGECCIHDVGWW
jgi:hypothetical protein